MPSNLSTVVKNTSGGPRYFAFIGRNGRTLAADEEYSVPGNLLDIVAAEDMPVKLEALKAVLAAGDLTIVSTPSPTLYDATAEETRILALDAEELGTVAPAYV